MKKLFFLFLIMAGQTLSQPFSLYPDEDNPGTSFFFSLINLYEENSESNSFSLTGNYLRGKYDYDWGNNKLGISFGRTDVRLKTDNKKSTVNFNINKKNEFVTLRALRKEKIVTLSAEADLTRNRKEYYFNYGFNVEFYFACLKKLKTEFGFSSNDFPVNLEAGYLGDDLNITGSFKNKIFSTRLGFEPWKEKTIQIGYKKILPFEKENGNGFFMKESPDIEIWHGSLNSNWNEVVLNANFFFLSGDYYSDLFNDEQTFGYIKVPELKLNGVVIDGSTTFKENSKTGVSLFYLFAQGNGVGNVQSWPFLSIVQSVIVNRLNYRFSFSGKLAGAGINHLINWGDYSFNPSVYYFDIQPNFILQTWQPAYLAIGVKEFTSNELKISRAGVALITLRGSYKIGEFFIFADINQFIPVYTSKKELPYTPPSPGEPEIKEKITSGGGRWFSVGISKQF